MRSFLLAIFLLLALASPSLACDCMATPADKVAGTYRAITALLCFLPLTMAYGLYRWLGHRLHDSDVAPATLPPLGNGTTPR